MTGPGGTTVNAAGSGSRANLCVGAAPRMVTFRLFLLGGSWGPWHTGWPTISGE